MALKTQNRNAKAPRPSRPTLSWRDVEPGTMRDFVTACTEAGTAVIFGKTLTGTALSICVLANEDKPKQYCQSLDDVPWAMADILAELDIERPASLQF